MTNRRSWLAQLAVMSVGMFWAALVRAFAHQLSRKILEGRGPSRTKRDSRRGMRE